jgi:hypothetical protein
MQFSRTITAFVTGLTCLTASAAPYAPADEAVKRFVAVPEADTVGIPAYPGARIFSAVGRIDPETKNSTLVLYTSAPKDKVLEFYKANLEGWTVGEIKETGDPLIHEGEGDLDPFSAQGMSTRHVLLGDGIEPMGQTRITISYHKAKPAPAQNDQAAEPEQQDDDAGDEE